MYEKSLYSFVLIGRRVRRFFAYKAVRFRPQSLDF
nr:MAG TPA: hypothetical protein [Crassvirales sp.]